VGPLRRWVFAKPERFRRWMNRFPAFRGSGARVDAISKDWHEWTIRLPLNWRTRNFVGTTFGGSLYGAVDPHLMIALIRLLGPEYIVWDKAASIRFKRPGRGTLWVHIRLPAGEVDEIRRLLQTEPKIDRTYALKIVDAEGVVHAEAEKVIHIRRSDGAKA
jgi:hypothetical protein